jgi:hypothetical protein
LPEDNPSSAVKRRVRKNSGRVTLADVARGRRLSQFGGGRSLVRGFDCAPDTLVGLAHESSGNNRPTSIAAVMFERERTVALRHTNQRDAFLSLNINVRRRVLQGPKPYSSLPECDLHVFGFPVSSAKGDDPVWAALNELSARGES